MIEWINAASTVISTPETAEPSNSTSAWTKTLVLTATAPDGAVWAQPSLRFQGVPIGEVHYVDAVIFEESTIELPYFDGAGIAPYPGYTLVSVGWNGTANASTSTANFIGVVQLRTVPRTATGSGAGTQSATRLITKPRTATGSGTGTQTATGFKTRFRTATGSGTGTQTAIDLVTNRRTATGSGTGTQSASRSISPKRTATGSGATTQTATIAVDQVILGGLTDFSFPYRFGGRFYVGAPVRVRMASGSGLGTQTASINILRTRTATGSGSSAQTATDLVINGRTATGSGSGSQSATGRNIFKNRTASGSGTGNQTATISVVQIKLGGLTDFSFPYRFGGRFYVGVLVISRTATGSGASNSSSSVISSGSRTATGSGLGSGSATKRTTAIRTATGSGLGTQSANRVVTKRRSASGTGTGSATATVFAVNTYIRSASGNGVGTSTSFGGVFYARFATGSSSSSSFAQWTKSLIFRPPSDQEFRWARYGATDTASIFFGRMTRGQKASNIYKMVDGSYTNIATRDYSLVDKVYHGGHENFVTAEEKADLITAGYGDYVS